MSTPNALAPIDEDALLVAARAGDEAAFRTLVRRHDAIMRRLARTFVRTDAVADEVVQEAWECVLRGLARFEQRCALQTWILRIVINRAKTRAARERRSVPFSALARDATGETVDADAFQPDGSWRTPPRPWTDPARRLLSLEVRAALRAALEDLPERQRIVVTLRDVEGLDAAEVSSLLGISEGNQRVLLHRGRERLRRALDAELAPRRRPAA
jgi:RNA polymerase sigma-70 factor (ECF subfamily)